MDLSHAFVTEVRRSALLPAGSRVLVACSAGGDSTALAVLIAGARDHLGLADLALAHLDHGLRPGSERDAEHATRLAERLGVRIVVERRRVEPRPGESPEAAARRVRYAFLRETAAALGVDLVATAHTEDDQAETVLLRILRGTGLRGLRGIPERRRLGPGLDIVRPLLSFRRDALRSFLAAAGIAWAEDPTNQGGNDRARLRHGVLPILADVSARDPVPLLARLAQNVSDRGDDVLAVATRFVARAAEGVRLLPGHERLPRGALRRALAHAAAELRGTQGLTRKESARLLDALHGGTADTVAGLRVVPGAGGAHVVRTGSPEEAPHPVPLSPEETVAVPWAGRRIHVVADREMHRAPPDAELVDAATLQGPLVVRPPSRGERFVPLGGGPARRVRSLLGKHGVPAIERAGYPVVADDSGVVVLPGVTLAERVKITETTTRRVAIGATPLSSSPPRVS